MALVYRPELLGSEKWKSELPAFSTTWESLAGSKVLPLEVTTD